MSTVTPLPGRTATVTYQHRQMAWHRYEHARMRRQASLLVITLPLEGLICMYLYCTHQVFWAVLVSVVITLVQFGGDHGHR